MIFVIAPAAILCAVYFTFMFKRALRVWLPQLSKTPTIVISVVLALALTVPCLFFNTWEIVILYLFLTGVTCDLVRLIVHLITKKRPPSGEKLKKVLKSGVIPVVATLLIVVFGVINMNAVRRTDYTVTTNKSLPDGGYTIAYVSDLHFGVSIDKTALQKYCAEIEKAKPDLLVLGGDIVDESTTSDDMQAVFDIFGKVKTRLGTYYVYGNHDRASYAKKPNFTTDQLAQTMKNCGIKVLRDESVDADEHLFIVGREDIGISHSVPFSKGFERASTAELMKNADKNKFVLMLDHQPVKFEENEAVGVDLQLSGHTHDGQIFPLKQLMLPFAKNELYYGTKKINNFTAIVSSGMAGWGFDIRTAGVSEYVIIKVEKGKQ